MKWFIPSWNGDVRVEAGDSENLSRLIVHEPTPSELTALAKLSAEFEKRKWIKAPLHLESEAYRCGRVTRVVEAPLKKVAPVVIKMLRPGKQVLSAVVLKDGKVETVEGSDMAALEPLAAKPEAKAGATVRRATPCCPTCHEGAISPATEALLSFLTPEQHEQWRDHRYLVAVGQITGHRYMLMHRNSERAARVGALP